MALLPPGLMARKLEWKDFPVRQMAPPAPGVVQISAGTAMDIVGGPLAVTANKDKTFKITAEPIITVVFKSTESFVADYVHSSWPQANQDALLNHEQQHYLISALTGRDYFNELNAAFKKTYPSSSALKADVLAAKAKYTPEALQAVSDKYDADTQHNPIVNTVAQAKWDVAIRTAIANPNRTLIDSLKLLNMLP